MPFWNNTTYSRIECAFFYTFRGIDLSRIPYYGKSGHTFLRLLYSKEKVRIFSALAVPKLCSLSERHRSRQRRGSARSPPKKIVKWGRKCAPCPLRRGLGFVPQPTGGLSPLWSVENVETLLPVLTYVAGVS